MKTRIYTLALLAAAVTLALSTLSAHGTSGSTGSASGATLGAGGAGNLNSGNGLGSGGAGNIESSNTAHTTFVGPGGSLPDVTTGAIGNQTTGNLPPPISGAAGNTLPLNTPIPNPSVAVTAGTSNPAFGFGNFSALDINHDGTINQDELNRFAFTMADQNHDGVIQSTEWGTYNTYLSTAFQSHFDDFNTLATNKSRLSQSEFSKGLSNAGYFNTWDTNGDGKVDQSEYIQGLNRYHINHDANGNIIPANGTIITNSGAVIAPGSGPVVIPNNM